MKRKIALIILSLVLVLGLMPATVAAAKAPPAPKFVDFNAGGVISYITPGDVFPAGASGRYIVQERELGGALAGSINGAYSLTYKANVELATQAGNLHGTLQTGSYSLDVNGKIEPLEFVGWYAPGIPLYYLEINGQWTFVNGEQGNGDFTAGAVFIPTLDGHVGYIVQSGFVMTGKWAP